MQITVAQRARSRALASAFSLPSLVFLAVSGSLLVGALVVGIVLGQRFEKKGQSSQIGFLTRSPFALNVVDPALSALKALAAGRENVPLNFAKGLTSDAATDRFVIDIKQEEFQKLSAKREEALRVGVLFTDDNDWVAGDVTLNGVAARAKLRLKGDWPDHYESDKWSLRIRLRGADNTLGGMRVFSIQKPDTRNFVHEWVMYQALRREGVLVPEYRFVDVTINGTRKGIYALEEHFEKQLIERSSLTEGPILKFNEELLWKEYVKLGTQASEYGSFPAAGLDGWAIDVRHGSQFERGVGMLEGFRRGRFRTTEVFDAQKLAAFIALRDVSGARGLPWENLRFYYNPLTSRIEPIGYDNEADSLESVHQLFGFDGGLAFKGAVARRDEFSALLFKDTDFFALYVRTLERMSDPRYVDDFVAAIDKDLKRQLRILYQDYPYVGWSPDFLRRNQAFIRTALSPEVGVHAYHQRTAADAVTIDLGNIQSLPIEVLGVSAGGKAPIPPPARVVLSARRSRELVDYLPVRFPLAAQSAESAATPLLVHYRVLGTETNRVAPVQEWSYLAPALLGQDWRLKPPPLEWPFLTVDKANKALIFKPGVWPVNGTVVLPAGYRVVAGPGLRLDLRKGAKIISFSRVEFLGDEDRPIVIESSDGSGQGFIVLQAKETSTLRHVVFDNLAPPTENGWGVTGAVTFYESPVDLDGVQFRRSRAEDALNIKRSRFSMIRTVFVDGKSDCFDGDFVQGKIEDSSFLRCANDAVDVSGSVVELQRVRTNEIGDKGVSAGENSQVVASDLKIERTEIGLASKDLSTLDVSSVEISGGGVGVTAFRKKPEFGESIVRVKGLQMRNMRKDQLIEKGSQFTLEGVAQPALLEKVDSILYGVEYGKASVR